MQRALRHVSYSIAMLRWIRYQKLHDGLRQATTLFVTQQKLVSGYFPLALSRMRESPSRQYQRHRDAGTDQ